MEDRFIRGAEESNGGGRILIGPRIDGRPSLLDFVLTGEKEKVTESMGSNLPVGCGFRIRLVPTPPPHPSTRTNLNYICLQRERFPETLPSNNLIRILHAPRLSNFHPPVHLRFPNTLSSLFPPSHLLLNQKPDLLSLMPKNAGQTYKLLCSARDRSRCGQRDIKRYNNISRIIIEFAIPID